MFSLCSARCSRTYRILQGLQVLLISLQHFPETTAQHGSQETKCVLRSDLVTFFFSNQVLWQMPPRKTRSLPSLFCVWQVRKHFKCVTFLNNGFLAWCRILLAEAFGFYSQIFTGLMFHQKRFFLSYFLFFRFIFKLLLGKPVIKSNPFDDFFMPNWIIWSYIPFN